MNNFEELDVWKKAMTFVTEIYEVVSKYPTEEKYGLTSQIKRSAVSIPSNIAEGAGRNSTNEFLHFLSIAAGSSYELQTHIMLSSNLKILDFQISEKLIIQLKEIQKMIYGLQKHLYKKLT